MDPEERVEGSPARCLVLGGSGTVGREVCRILAEAGSPVAFTWNRTEVDPLPGAHGFRLDLGCIDDIHPVIRQAADRLGGLDALVQCAAVGVTMECHGDDSPHRISRIDEGGWDRMMAVNTKSTFFAVKAAAPILREGGGGNIVLLGSIDGVKPVPSPVHYAASKGALRGMTQALAKELGEYRIRVNMVAAGVLEEGLSRSLPEDLRQEYVKHCGLRRLGRVEEVASLVSHLVLQNTYVTGQTILLDGAL